MNIANRIFELMAQSNTNAITLAKSIGVSPGVITQWKQNKQNPSSEALMKVATFFGVSADYLLGISEIRNAYGVDDTYRHTRDEKYLLSTYRKLTPNSKQIVLSLVESEFNHVKAFVQGESSIQIVKKSKLKELDEIVSKHLENKKMGGSPLKVYNQTAAAGSGNHLSDNGDDDYEMVPISSIPYGADFGIRISGDSMESKIHDGDIAFVKRQPAIDVGEIGIFIYNGESFCKQMIYKGNRCYLHSLNPSYEDMPVFGESIYCIGKVIGSARED